MVFNSTVSFSSATSSAARETAPREIEILFASADANATQVLRSLNRPCTNVVVVNSGAKALAATSRRQFDIAFIDEQLADTEGLEVARALRRLRRPTAFALFGNNVPTATTVEAMKLGAFTVFNKPVTAQLLVTTIDTARVAAAIGFGHATPPRVASRVLLDALRGAKPTLPTPRSTAERWAMLVLRVCQSDTDLPTLAAWASFVGLSYSSLGEYCRLLDIHPRDARDFARLLRAVIRCRLLSSSVVEVLDIGDRRTLYALLARGGLDRAGAGPITVEEFLTRQQFVAVDNPGLIALRAFLFR
jgi:ActR/RegA family two-component response regulator